MHTEKSFFFLRLPFFLILRNRSDSYVTLLSHDRYEKFLYLQHLQFICARSLERVKTDIKYLETDMSFIALNIDDCRRSNFFYKTVSTFFHCYCVYIVCQLQNSFAKFEMKTHGVHICMSETVQVKFCCSEFHLKALISEAVMCSR